MDRCCNHETRPAPATTSPGAQYTCPMHPQIRRKGPGDCPLCGMALEPADATADGNDAELRDMTRRLVVGAILAVPVFILGMSHLFHGSSLGSWAASDTGRGVQAFLATQVVFWCG